MTKINIFLLFFLIMGGILFSINAQDSTRVTTASGGVIEIEAQVLDVRVELPQVQILDKRKKSEFDEVKVEKNFSSELSGKNEELKFTPNTSGRISRIENIDALVNKKRF